MTSVPSPFLDLPFGVRFPLLILGMEPPPPPLLVAPGEYTLYHEWGHHVDRTWSGVNQEVAFFTAGIRSVAYLPPIRPALFGANTDEMVGHLRDALGRARAEWL